MPKSRAFLVNLSYPLGQAIEVQPGSGETESALACADLHGSRGNSPHHNPDRATERVAVLMTPSEKAAYADRANSLGLSLGQFFREAGAAYAGQNSQALAEAEVLEAALRQLECSTSRTAQTLDVALAEVRAALSARP